MGSVGKLKLGSLNGVYGVGNVAKEIEVHDEATMIYIL
jgi:hypothetical protein